MKDIGGKNYFCDGTLIESTAVSGFNDVEKFVIYEVIRVINRTGVFLQDHLERLNSSLKRAQIPAPAFINDISEHIRLLGETNGVEEYNVKVLITAKENNLSSYAIYIMQHFYPSVEMYDKGVAVGLMQWERNDPNTKTVNSNFKDIAAKLMDEKDVFEVLLVNEKKLITEGSRTNAFFVSGDKVYTASKDYILEGITRKYVLAACEKSNIQIIEKLVRVDELPFLDGAFISGTSLKVLPISKIDEITLKSYENKVIKRIMEQYDVAMNQYIKSFIKG